jgi:hypothetical protein
VHAEKPGEDGLNANHDDMPLRLHPLNDILGDIAPPDLMHQVLDVELNFTSAEEPGTFHEVEQSESRQQAICEEMKSIQDNNT